MKKVIYSYKLIHKMTTKIYSFSKKGTHVLVKMWAIHIVFYFLTIMILPTWQIYILVLLHRKSEDSSIQALAIHGYWAAQYRIARPLQETHLMILKNQVLYRRAVRLLKFSLDLANYQVIFLLIHFKLAKEKIH